MLKFLSSVIIAISSLLGLNNEPIVATPRIELLPIKYDTGISNVEVDVPTSEAEKMAINEDNVQEMGAGNANTAETVIAGTNTSCSCVSYIRKMTSFTFPRVSAAKEIPVLNFDPLVGSVALFKPSPQYSQFGHVALVIEVASTTFKVSEFNFVPCKITVRTINKNDPLLRGFFDNRH